MGLEGGGVGEIEGFDVAVDDFDEFFDFFGFVGFEIERERDDLVGMVGSDVIDAPASDFIIFEAVRVFNEELIEVKLELVGESAAASSPLLFRRAGLEVGDDDGFRFFIDFDAVDFAGEESVVEGDSFVVKAKFGLGFDVAEKVAFCGEKSAELAFATVAEVGFVLFIEVGGFDFGEEAREGFLVGKLFAVELVHGFVDEVAVMD